MDKFRTKDGKEVEITAEGSLGLLALGYRGLIAWRKKRMEAAQTNTEQVQNTKHQTLDANESK